MKKNFYTGLVVVLPLFISFYIFNWLLKMVIKLISGTTITMAIRYLLKTIYSGQDFKLEFQILTYIISIAIIVLFITLLGYTTKIVFFSKIMKKIVNIIEKIPVIKYIYTTSKQIIEMIYKSDGELAYKKVVLVEYPKERMYAIGFMTSETNQKVSEVTGHTSIANVFIPTSPNPTSGMLVCVPKEDIKNLDIDIETAFKLIISGGYVTEESIKELEKTNDNREMGEKK